MIGCISYAYDAYDGVTFIRGTIKVLSSINPPKRKKEEKEEEEEESCISKWLT